MANRTEPRCAEQIVIDALTVEGKKLQTRQDKINADLNATPWMDVQAVRKAAAGLDLKTSAGRDELSRLAEQEKKHLAEMKRIQRLDIVKLSDISFVLQMEIEEISRLIFTNSLRISRKNS